MVMETWSCGDIWWLVQRCTKSPPEKREKINSDVEEEKSMICDSEKGKNEGREGKR